MKRCVWTFLSFAFLLGTKCFSFTSRPAFNANNEIRLRSTSLRASALIIQNKGGGHGELGYQLAKKLMQDEKFTSITILQDQACKDSQEPFKSYPDDLPSVKIVKAALSDETMTASDLQSILGEGTKFDYVWDNASKEPVGAGKACVDCAKTWNVKLYTYVSSAGVYKPTADTVFPMSEGTPVKSTAGQVALENYAVEQGLPLVAFRPQYIYGEKANKHDYIDYFLDRIVRGLPVPIPGDGSQLVSLTNSHDVASLLVSPLNNEAAAVDQRIFNCGTDQLISYNDVAKMCAQVAGVEDSVIEHYDPELFEKTVFPFRNTNFYVDPSSAKKILDWKGPERDLASDLPAYFDDYKARGGPTKKMSLMKDWEICVGCKTPPQGYSESIYDQYDPLILEVSSAKN